MLLTVSPGQRAVGRLPLVWRLGEREALGQGLVHEQAQHTLNTLTAAAIFVSVVPVNSPPNSSGTGRVSMVS